MQPATVPGWARRAVPPVLLAALVGGALAVSRAPALERADLVFNNGTEVSSLDPHAVSGAPEGRLVGFLFEGLVVRHPRTLEPLPGMAESWELSPDGLTWTFRLRADSGWSNGDPVTAHDFEYAFRRLLDPRTAAPYASQLFCVKGAARWAGELDAEGAPLRDWATVGIRAASERELVIVLRQATPYFLNLLASFPFSPVHRASLEAARERWPDDWEVEWLRPDHLVTNGPFHPVLRRLHDRLRMERNEHYWDAQRVAFRTVDALAVDRPTTALNLYLTGEIDWIERIPSDLVPLLLPREDFQPSPYLGVYFYRINCTKPPLDDARVRRALALAVGRPLICGKILKAGQVPAYSFVPPGMPGYEPLSVERGGTLGEQLRLAKQALAEAGFDAERPFPGLQIHYNTGGEHRDVAEVVAENWHTVLGIEAELSGQEWKAFLDAQRNLDYDVSRSSWLGDYLDPTTFLDVFRSDNENNRTGWADPRYDRLLERAARSTDPAARTALLQDAERLLLEEMPAIPIYFYVSQNVVNPRLGGFFENLQDVHPPKFLYWKDNPELRASRRTAAGQRLIRAPAEGPAEGLYPRAGRDTWSDL